MNRLIENTNLELVIGDITDLNVEAIVNPANQYLQMGGGVAGAVRRKGGTSIQMECNKIGGIPVGTAVITTAGNLPANFVIHAVGPRMGEGDEDKKLRNATFHALKIADQNNLSSIAFPAISTGIFGYPMERCAQIMLHTTAEYVKNARSIKKVIFCLFNDNGYSIFSEVMRTL